MLLSLPVCAILLGVRHSAAVRSISESHGEKGALIAEGGELKDFPGEKPQEKFPDCSDIARSTYPGGCDPKASAYACYSKERVYRPEGKDVDVEVDVDVHWACSAGWNKFSKAECQARPWNFHGTVNGTLLTFTAPAGIYAGACEFATLLEEKTTYSQFPDCRSVMQTYPGGCNPKVSGFACYNRKETTSSEMPSLCSAKLLDKGQISEGTCLDWGYAGACQFESPPDLPSTAPKQAEQDTAKASEDSPSTTAEQADPDTTKPVQDLPSTTTEQAGPVTTKKNAAAGGATGFLLVVCIGLAHLLHPKP